MNPIIKETMATVAIMGVLNKDSSLYSIFSNDGSPLSSSLLELIALGN